MTSPVPASVPLDPLRRELILAQVQLMELEDTRDDLRTQLAASQMLLVGTQQLADNALREQAHCSERLAALRGEHERLVTTVSGLNAQLAETSAVKSALASRVAELEQHLAARDRELAARVVSAQTAAARISELAAERQAMQVSRSWRWTAPLRALERALRGRGGERA
ncbi:MAG: hypothetical protein QM691_14645 [Opitutaceae bacterium]